MKIIVPRLNPNDDSVLIAKWHVADGSEISKDMPLVDIETSKTVVTLDATVSGKVAIHVLEGGYAEVDSCVGMITQKNDKEVITEKKYIDDKGDENKHSLSKLVKDKNQVILSKAAQKYVRDNSIELAKFTLSGLITIHDLKKTSNSKCINKNLETNSPQLKAEGIIAAREKLHKPAKREEIRQLQIGQSGLINSTVSIQLNLSKEYGVDKNDNHKFEIFKYNLIEIICKTLVDSLEFTAYYYENKIHYYDRVDLGLALDLGEGLKVVRIKDANELNATQLRDKVADLTLEYMRNELRIDQLTGSTFTVTDLTSENILHFIPLINGKQSIIIGLGADRYQQDFIMSIIISFDHRVLTGRQVARFLNTIRTLIK